MKNGVVRPFSTKTLLAIVILLTTAPASGQIIQQGIDAFVTASGTKAEVDLPAGFFCEGSPAISSTVAFKGMPLATDPANALGGANTVVERLKDADLKDGCATVPVVVRALKLMSEKTFSVNCKSGRTKWSVSACTGCCCGGAQPITKIKICQGEKEGCGTFNGQLRIAVCLKFKNVEDQTVLGPIQQQVVLGIDDWPWSATNPGAVIEAKTPFLVDTDCDSQADLAVPCSTNFFPGAECGGPPCPPRRCHAGPSEEHLHCVEPPCFQDKKSR